MYKSLREIYGQVYLISFPDGTDIPFNSLSYGDFHYYNEALSSGIASPSTLEDEVFRKCVQDKAILDNMSLQKAGTISATVSAIMQVSGPGDVSEFNEVLSHKRVEASKPRHQLVSLICRAFPSYAPEDVDAMDFDTMLLRLAQAESILMSAQMLKEPIALQDQSEQQEQPQNKNTIPTPELKTVFEQSMKMDPDLSKLSEKADQVRKHQEKQESPAAQKPNDIMSLMKDSMSGEAQDSYSDDDRLKSKMVNDANWVFKDLIKQVQQKHSKKGEE